jgi:hypothetical protein
VDAWWMPDADEVTSVSWKHLKKSDGDIATSKSVHEFWNLFEIFSQLVILQNSDILWIRWTLQWIPSNHPMLKLREIFQFFNSQEAQGERLVQRCHDVGAILNDLNGWMVI